MQVRPPSPLLPDACPSPTFRIALVSEMLACLLPDAGRNQGMSDKPKGSTQTLTPSEASPHRQPSEKQLATCFEEKPRAQLRFHHDFRASDSPPLYRSGFN